MVERYSGIRKRQVLASRRRSQQTEEMFRSQTQREVQKKVFQRQAKNYDNMFENTNFSNISQIQTELNKIDPNIRQYMTFNLDKVKANQNKIISSVQSNIQTSKQRQDTKDSARRSKYQAEERAYKEALQRLQKGELLKLGDINNYASGKGKEAYRYRKYKEQKKTIAKKIEVQKGILSQAEQKILRQAQAGKATITFTDTRTNKTTTQTVDLNAQAKAEAKKILARLEKESSKLTLKQQLAKLEKEKGLKPQIVDVKTGKVIQAGQFKLDKEAQRKISSIQNQLRLQTKRAEERYKEFEKSLGGLSKVFTPQQKRELMTSNVFISQPSIIQRKLIAIDKDKKLNPIQKENKKRELLGITAGDPIKQGLFPKMTNQEIKNILNTIGVSATPTSKYRQIENKLREEYFRIANKPVDKRTDKEKALISVLGTGSFAMGTLRKVPLVIWDIIVALASPIDTTKALIKLLFSKEDQEALKSDLRVLGQRAAAGDPDAMSEIVSEILGTKAFNKVGELKRLTTLSPNYVKFEKGKFKLKTPPKETFTVKGKERFLKARVQPPSIKRPVQTVVDYFKGRKPGQFKKFQKTPGLILKSQSVQSGAMDFAKQFETYSGKKIIGVNASAQGLTSVFKRKQIIRKPFNLSGLEKRFPKGENSFPKKIRDILNDFDNGRNISINRLIYLNTWLRKNIANNVTILERSLYLDPASGLRLSRLGIAPERTATLKDILKWNFQLFRTKPQVLIFENLEVAKAPKPIKDIVNKIKTKGTNYPGFDIDLAVLSKWQTKKGKQLAYPAGSPIYKGGVELEVTIAPGELIKRVKQIGFTYIEAIKENGKTKFKVGSKGTRVTFVTAEVYKPQKSLLERMRKAYDGKLDAKQVKQLEKELSKKLGRKIRVETPEYKKSRRARRTTEQKPILRPQGRFIRVLRTPPVRKSPVRKPTPRKSPVRKSPVRKPTPRKSPVRKPTPRKPPVRKPPVRKPTPLKFPRPSIGSSKLKDKVIQFEAVFRERRNRSKPFNKKSNPVIVKKLTFKDTKNRILKKVADLADKRTVRSIELRLLGLTSQKKKDIKMPNVIKKFRQKRGRDPTVLKLVEKSKYTIDTPTEKRELKYSKKK